MRFDDFLDLATRDLSLDRLILFTGRSGSGKSTAIRFLLAEHPDFRDREARIVEGPPFARLDRPVDVVVIDDITSVADLGVVWHYLQRSGTLLVASHLHPAWFAPLRALMHFPRKGERRAPRADKCSFFRTDADTRKLERYLADRGVAASADALATYAAAFRATYTDLDIILERCPSDSLDRALATFLKFNAIRESDPFR